MCFIICLCRFFEVEDCHHNFYFNYHESQSKLFNVKNIKMVYNAERKKRISHQVTMFIVINSDN